MSVITERVNCSWGLAQRCNYRCPYCWFDSRWHEIAAAGKYYPARVWIDFWDRIHARYGEAHIAVVGQGEPFLYPGFADILREVAKKHILAVVTNLSWEPGQWVSSLSPSRVRLHASYHPQFAGSIEKFTDKILSLKERGFEVAASVVAYPANFDQLADSVEAISARGILCVVKAYWGIHQGRDYPASYTEDQRRFFQEKGDRQVLDYEIGDVTTLGKLCRAGQFSFAVSSNGAIRRCANTQERIGHVLDKNFRLFDGPRPCPVEKCRCAGFSVYLVENDGHRLEDPRYRAAGQPVLTA